MAGTTVSKFNSAFVAIAGFELGLSKNWAARVSYTHTDFGSTEILGNRIDHKVDRFSIGMLYRTVPVR